jgi:hypothetical protein
VARNDRRSEDLLSVDQLAADYNLGRSTVWLYLRRHQVPRFRTAATGKTTLVRWGDWEQALHSPVPVTRPVRQDAEDAIS